MGAERDPARGHRLPGEAVAPVREIEPPDLAQDIHAVQSEESRASMSQPVWLPVRLTEWAGAALVLFLAAAVTVGVITRAAGSGIIGLLELSALGMVVLTLLGAPGMTYRDENVRLEIVDLFASPRVLRVLNILSDVFQLVVVALIIYAAYLLFEADLSRGTTVGGEMRLSRSWITGLVGVAFLVVAVTTVRKLWHDLRRPRGGAVEAAPEQGEEA